MNDIQADQYIDTIAAEHDSEYEPDLEPHDEGTSYCTSQPEHIHVTPSPEMRAAVLAALEDSFAGPDPIGHTGSGAHEFGAHGEPVGRCAECDRFVCRCYEDGE